MLRRILALIFVVAILLAPSASFAFNAKMLNQAQSCCDKMSGSCGDSATPLTCCKKQLVQLEPHKILTQQHSTIHIALEAIHLPLAVIDSAQSSQQLWELVQATDSPPPKVRYSLVLRI
jgi:hypothetical protein